MIVDIVELPRRLKQFKHRDASINSETIIGFPISSIYRIYGYNDYNDDDFIGIGGNHRVITGTDALFRYKFVEPTKYGLAEYFMLTSSPIDIRHPLGNKRIKLYCPWVTLTDAMTLKVRKFILWNNIFELMHYETEDSIIDSPVESVLANEIRNFSMSSGYDAMSQEVAKYPKNFTDTPISEEVVPGEDAVSKLATLGANIKAYNEMTLYDMPFYWCEPTDVFRGLSLPEVWTDTSVLRGCSLITHVARGSIELGDIRHLFGMTYDTHAFQRTFNDQALNPYTEISIYGDDHRDLFGIFKNIERINYGEFAIVIRKDGSYDITLYNQYDPYVRLNLDKTAVDKTLLEKIVSGLKNAFPNLECAEIIRSYEECVYITIKNTNGTIKRFYFDLVSASLGTRSLIRDYNGHMF